MQFCSFFVEFFVIFSFLIFVSANSCPDKAGLKYHGPRCLLRKGRPTCVYLKLHTCADEDYMCQILEDHGVGCTKEEVQPEFEQRFYCPERYKRNSRCKGYTYRGEVYESCCLAFSSMDACFTRLPRLERDSGYNYFMNYPCGVTLRDDQDQDVGMSNVTFLGSAKTNGALEKEKDHLPELWQKKDGAGEE